MTLPDIHLCIVQPAGHEQALGLLDPARYFRYHFRRLGARVSLSKNRLRHDAVNFVFGAHLGFDERQLDGDVVKEFGGVNVVTDKMSAPYLMGATIDFVDAIEKQGFTIDNPNAQGSCACGDSFH